MKLILYGLINGKIWHIKRDNATKVISHSSERGIEIKPEDIIINKQWFLMIEAAAMQAMECLLLTKFQQLWSCSLPIPLTM